MNILWLNWKDSAHPQAGGAEVVLHELSERLVADGHEVTILTAAFPGAKPRETKNGVHIIRIGHNRYLHSFQALGYYLQHLRNKFDIVLEVVNTAPYFSVLFGGKAKRFLFYHQLAREIWYHETTFPLNHVGYKVLEPLATRLLRMSKAPVITISESTKQDLVRWGFKPKDISIISQGISMQPVGNLDRIEKFAQPTILSFGSVRSMKRTIDHVKAFEIAKQAIPSLRLIIGGGANGAYGQRVRRYAAASPYAKDIEFKGYLSDEQKYDLMRRCHLTVVTSVKEGWCLTVTEAASQGAPAVVYNVDGLRDSVKHDQTGLIVRENTPVALADGIVELLGDPADHEAKHNAKYQRLRAAAWQWSKTITFDQSYQDFKQAVGIV